VVIGRLKRLMQVADQMQDEFQRDEPLSGGGLSGDLVSGWQ
jgi:hypothetical protein